MTAKERLAQRLAARMIARRAATGEDQVIEPTLAEALTRAVAEGEGLRVRSAVSIIRDVGPEGAEIAMAGDGLTEAEARALAPDVARAAMPERLWGEALHSEWHEHKHEIDGVTQSGDWHVVVEDRGPIGFDGQVH
jgi:hypothetical protein